MVDYDSPEDLGRGVFDMLWWLVITVVLLNLILGVIIDTFSELRVQRERQTAILRDFDFITCAHKSDFVSMTAFKQFRAECKQENYLYFIHHVLSIKPEDRSGLEAFVVELLNIDDISWLPMKEHLERTGHDAKQDQQIEEIKAMVGRLLNPHQEKGSFISADPSLS